MIEYRELDGKQLPAVLEIYQKAGWTAYLTDCEKLARAFGSSLYTLGAFDGDILAGFVRCVGDGEHIVYVQDLIVDIPYKQRGIGKMLLCRAMEKYVDVRMFMLVTDASDAVSNTFYTAVGMKHMENAGCVAYIR